jgi:hypothetical protein
MKQGEKREKTGAKQGGNLTAFKRLNGRNYRRFPTQEIAAKWGEDHAYFRGS